MSRMTVCISLLLLPFVASAQSYIHTFTIVPEEPQDGDTVSLIVAGDMPDGCWSLANVDGYLISLADGAAEEIDCIMVLVPFEATFELGALMTGVHQVLISEFHDSVRNPGLWTHTVQFTVGNPPTPAPTSNWSRIKALYR